MKKTFTEAPFVADRAYNLLGTHGTDCEVDDHWYEEAEEVYDEDSGEYELDMDKLSFYP